MSKNRLLTVDGSKARHELAISLATTVGMLNTVRDELKAKRDAAKRHLKPMEQQAMTALIDCLSRDAEAVHKICDHVAGTTQDMKERN